MKLADDGWMVYSGKTPKGTITLHRGEQELSVSLDIRGNPEYRYMTRP